MSRRMISAQFTEPAEWLGEVERDRALVERGIARVTRTARPVFDGTLTRVEVRASVLVEGRIVDLCAFCGDLWQGPEDETVQARASMILDGLKQGLTDMGLEVRGGLWRDE